jgi:glycosyltransferase involved in cell wall biosynthesis
MPRIPIVVFAQVPPPEHGQSRMVKLALEALRARPDLFDVHHVNSRFSHSLDEIGESSIGKFLVAFRYLYEALHIRFRTNDPILYYVPGPVKRSAVVRDWILLGVLRLFYPRVVFHWHAIGHGEWAHGSERLKMEGPPGFDRVARRISALMLRRPYASIAVSENSRKDDAVLGSMASYVICNGIADPCPEFDAHTEPLRRSRQQELRDHQAPDFRILFLSHGTQEKGITDGLESIGRLMEQCDAGWRVEATFAGGVSADARAVFDALKQSLLRKWNGRLRINEDGYVSGDEKNAHYLANDLFLAPSRWESFGLTVIEAMAHGLPIVAAASDGVEGVLPDGHPYLAAVKDPIGLGDKLHACCQALIDGKGFEEGRRLRDHYLERYQIKDFAGNLTKTFQELGRTTAGTSPAADALERRPCPEKHDKSVVPPQSEAPHHPQSTIQDLPSLASSSPNNQSPLINNSSHALAVNTSSSSSSTSMFDVGCSMFDVHPPPSSSSQHFSVSDFQHLPPPSPISLSIYLADQNPGHDRSYGISRMTQVVLEALQATGRVEIGTISSKTSQQAPEGVGNAKILPWGTRRKWVRLMTDHLHPLFVGGGHGGQKADVHYFPKGYLPYFSGTRTPSVVTIHDTIIQHDQDCYPNWRKRWEYRYWARILKHTLHNADRIITVSQTSKRQIEAFMERHGIPAKEITVTYESCLYESVPQPVDVVKENYVIHLASLEPHKRTAHLIRWWLAAEARGQQLPTLHLIGSVPPEVMPLLASSRSIVKRPFLDEAALQDAYLKASALILPSEIEGFGLPALEAYYLGTPVCYVKGTSVEEILSVATHKGGFNLQEPQSLFAALDEVMSMSADEVQACGLQLRQTYSAQKVANRMLEVFEEVRGKGKH